MNNEAFDEGYDAYWEGVEDGDNPYDEDTESDARISSWEEGYSTTTTRTTNCWPSLVAARTI